MTKRSLLNGGCGVLERWLGHRIIPLDAGPGRGLVRGIEVVAKAAGRGKANRTELVHKAPGPVRVRAIGRIDVSDIVPELLIPANLLIVTGSHSCTFSIELGRRRVLH